MKKKQLLSLAMAGAMSAGILAGCGQSGSSTPASGSAGGSGEDPVTITWMIRAEEPKNYDNVMAAVNEKLLEDINMQLDLRFIAPGDYDTKMQMAMAGGDDWDLCFTSHWANNYVNAAGKGAYLELTDEMLQENAPNLMATIPEQLWDGIRVNGKIFALMNYQVMYDQPGFLVMKSAVDEQNIDVDSIDSWEDLDNMIKTLAEAYPDKYATRGMGVAEPKGMFQEEHLSTIMSLPFLYVDADTLKISNDGYFEKISDFLHYAYAWKEAGYTPADAATMKDEQTMLTQEQILTRYNRMKPGPKVNQYYNGPFKVDFAVGPSVIDTSAVQSTLTGVNVNSKNPEKAIQLYDYIFGNKEVSNMLFFGLEGEDYELVDGRVKTFAPDCWTAPAWELGNQFNALLTENDPDGVWEETMRLNAEAPLDLLFGFVPDRTPVETELATCEAIWLEYKDILYYGLRPSEEVIPEMLDKLDKAGLAKVTEEMQRQLDEFFASKK